MNDQSREPLRRELLSVGRNLLAFAFFWIVLSGAASIARLAPDDLHDWKGLTVALLIACVIGAAIAVSLRARFAALILAGQVAFGAVELAMHGYFGIHTVQGGPTHWAIMGAGTLGAVLGALIEDEARSNRTTLFWKSNDVFGSVLSAAIVLRKRTALLAHTLAGLIAFASAELIYTVFGLNPFRDVLTHFAIVGSAVVGVVLGVLIETRGNRLALPRFSSRRAELASAQPGAMEMLSAR